jgi:hypothetical protein
MEFSGKLFAWDAQESGSWFFIRLPNELADFIRDVSGPGRGFGSVRVEARIGTTQWRTSIFPDSKSGSYVLPVKKHVRTAEGIDAGDVVAVALELVD